MFTLIACVLAVVIGQFSLPAGIIFLICAAVVDIGRDLPLPGDDK